MDKTYETGFCDINPVFFFVYFVSPPDFLCVTKIIIRTYTEFHREDTERHRDLLFTDPGNSLLQ